MFQITRGGVTVHRGFLKIHLNKQTTLLGFSFMTRKDTLIILVVKSYLFVPDTHFSRVLAQPSIGGKSIQIKCS